MDQNNYGENPYPYNNEFNGYQNNGQDNGQYFDGVNPSPYNNDFNGNQNDGMNNGQYYDSSSPYPYHNDFNGYQNSGHDNGQYYDGANPYPYNNEFNGYQNNGQDNGQYFDGVNPSPYNNDFNGNQNDGMNNGQYYDSSSPYPYYNDFQNPHNSASDNSSNSENYGGFFPLDNQDNGSQYFNENNTEQVPYAEEGYMYGEGSGYSQNEYGYQDEEEKKRKWIIPLILIFIILIAAIVLFFKACRNEDDNVRFEVEERSREIESLEGKVFTLPTDDEKAEATVSIETTKNNRPSRLSDLTTRSTSKKETERSSLSIEEQSRKESEKKTTTEKTTQRTQATTANQPTQSVVQPTAQPTTARTTSNTTRATTAAPTTKATTQATTKATTKETTKETTEPTTTPTTEETTPPTEPAPTFADPVQATGYPELPASVNPNPNVPGLLASLESGSVMSQDGKYHSSKSGDSETSFTITDEGGNKIVIENLENPLSSVAAVSKNYAYFISGDKLIRYSLSDKTETEITGVSSPGSANYRTDLHDNLIVENGGNLVIVPAGATEQVSIGSGVSNIKLQGDTLGFISGGQVRLVNLAGSITSDSAKAMPEGEVSSYALSADGSAVYVQSGSSLTAYKSGLVYKVSSDVKDYLVTTDASYLVVLENSNKLNILNLQSKIELVGSYEEVDGSTISNNKTLNYNGNYVYANADESLQITHLDGSSESVSIK